LEAEFEPGKYHDAFRANVRAMIDAKIEGREVVAAADPRVAPVIDIMEALKRSLAEKRKPVQAAVASAPNAMVEDEAPAAAAPKKRARAGRG
jgi:DNA end-binding protein Ku